jgi:hypothetical protein
MKCMGKRAVCLDTSYIPAHIPLEADGLPIGLAGERSLPDALR